MDDFYDEIFSAFKEYIVSNSEYSPRVIKFATQQSTYFPLITCFLSDDKDNVRTQGRVDSSNKYYFTIDIYTQDSGKIASYIINQELRKLTNKFFGELLGLVKTQDKPTPNLDTNVLRRTIYYQCDIDSRGNITRV